MDDRGEPQQRYLSILRSGAARMLPSVIDVYPAGLIKDEISAKVGIVATSGTFSTYLGELRRNGLIEQRGSQKRSVIKSFGRVG